MTRKGAELSRSSGAGLLEGATGALVRTTGAVRRSIVPVGDNLGRAGEVWLRDWIQLVIARIALRRRRGRSWDAKV